jgi:pilus assembly protein CpaF
MPAAVPPRQSTASMSDSDEVTPLPSSTSSPRGVAPTPERAPFGQPSSPAPERAAFSPSPPPSRVAPVAEPAPMPSPPMSAPMSAPPLRTPGVGAVVPRPRFVQQRDAAFAQAQARAAEAFFAAVDPRELPAHYPPSPEDRQPFEGAARDAAGRAGAGADLANHLLNEAVGLGPLDALLDDPSVEEIYVNSFDQVLYKQEGRVVCAPRAYSHPDFLYLAAQRLLAGRMEEPDAQPLEEVRFSDGTRVTLIMPPLAPRGPALIVRKHRAQAPSLQELTQAGALSPAMAQLLTLAVESGRNLLIAGPRQSGRLELMGALGALIPEGARVVTVEDAPGLQLPQSSAVRLESNAAYDLRYLVKAALRLQPDRILLNALSGPEAYDWITAAAAGSFGSMALGHGLNAQDALGALTTLAQLGAPGLSSAGLREQVARAVHLVVVAQRDAQGLLRVQQITEVQGVDFDDYRLNDIFTFRPEPSGGGHAPTGYVPMFCEALRAAGIAVDNHLFQP